MTKRNYWIIAILGILVSAFVSYQMRWLGDDIFITLRYVKNFNAGNGLVYNIGERVEGYTDFLWLMLISAFSRLHFDAEIVGMILGFIFSLGTLIIFTLIGHKVSLTKKKIIFPFVVLALAANYDYNVWATSGLEVSFVTFLLSSAFYIYFFTTFTFNKKLLLSGLFICLALLTRPDVMLILIFLNLLLFIRTIAGKEGFGSLIKTHLLFNSSVLLLYLPYFLLRYNYYGFIFPNTYYDKLGYETAFAQGFTYIWMYFKIHFTSFLILIPFFSLFLFMKKQGVRNFILNKEYAPLTVCVSVLVVYLLFFVAKVGGDFMFARFIIPCTPFIYFSIFYYFFLIDFKCVSILLFAILCLSGVETYVRSTLFIATDAQGNETPLFPDGIADERYCYLYFSHTEREIKRGKELHELLEGIQYKAIIYGAQARLAYYADFPYCQEYFGLTDTLIAHSEIPERGRIGHEKHATVEYIESKRINFSFNAGSLKDDAYRAASIDLPSGPLTMEIITYETTVMEKFSERLGKNFHYVDFPNYLDIYVKDSLPKVTSRTQLEETYKKFKAYYFKNNADPEREDHFISKLKELKQ